METKMIGSKIAIARKKVNISQAQLAQRLFISPQAVGKWERGESIPDLITFNRLAAILGVDLNYFSENFSSDEAGQAPAVLSIQQPAGLSTEKQEQTLSWDMSRGNWIDADFSGLKNLNDKFSSSNIQRCLFTGSELSGLQLNSNNIDSCDFSGSDISNSHIQYSHLVNNRFQNCSMKGTAFSKSYFEACDFSGADFTGIKFASGGFGNNNVTNAIWNHSSFIDTHIADIVFDSTVEDCYFENCAFTRVTFQNVTLKNTFFKNNRKLKQVRFIDCTADNLTYAFLKTGKADMSGLTLLTV
jgi:transcriptional regulator with XRE-family HTH domain